ncbi:MAG: phenylalanine--tRNA ligase subunit beta, partial [Alphaproteobacteria bacterium]
ARFERGVDQALPRLALDLATQAMIEMCGGEASEIVGAGPEPAWQRQTSLRFERLARYGGDDVAPDRAVEILQNLGFTLAARDAARVTVNVPSWRNDVAGKGALAQAAGLSPERARAAAEGCAEIEPECDLIEEVLRIRGLNTIAPVSLPVSGIIPPPAFTPKQARASLARRVLAARGMQEAVTFAFMESETAALFGETPAALRLENPIAEDLDQMRPTPVASLLLAAGRNAAHGFADIALCEIGAAYQDVTPDGQAAIAAGVRHGATPRHWAEASRSVDALDAKGDAMAVLAALGLPMAALSVTADAPGFYHPGRSGQVRQGPKTVLARFGEIHPRVLAALDLPGPAVAFEVFLDAIPEPKRRKKGAPDLPAFQPLRRDFAFLVDESVAAEALIRAARGAERTLITDALLFDRYAGDKLPAGKVSLALQVTIQPREATLTDPQIEALADKIVAAVAKATGAVLRA